MGFLLPSVESDLAGVSQSYLHPSENFVSKLLEIPNGDFGLLEIAEEPRMDSVIDVDINQNNVYYF